MKVRVLAVVFLLVSGAVSAQLKVGSNPSQINKSSILELESSRQGLLLPRIPGSNLTAAPLNTAPDGMIIYVTDSASLFIRKNSLWQRMSVDSVSHNKAIASLNGLRDTAQTFAIDSAAAKDVAFNSAAGVHTLNVPTQDGNGTTSRGLLSYRDWQRFDSSARFRVLQTAFSNAADNNGISIADGALTLHAADATQPGAVNTGDQSFGGYKGFRDSLSIGVAPGTKGNATFQLIGSMSTNITKVSGNYSANAGDNTILADATSGAVTVTLPSPGAIAGRIYTIKKVGSGGIDKEVTIATSGGSIDGSNNYIIYNDWTFVTLQTDGTDWYVIKK